MALDLNQIPNTPGIYKFFSKNKIIYIGKAKNLKKRVSSYFGKSFKDRKTHQIRILTDKIETFSTITEAEALLLEQSLIKENLPRFNILLRDDKTYPYVHFSMENKYPSISMKRSKHAVSKNFFGPFISAYAVKSTIKDLQKIYQIRNCSDSTFKNRSRPCIEHQMQRCSAPCVDLISEVSYQEDIASSQDYLSSSGKKIKSLMISQMQKLAANQEFERANEIKKRIRSFDLLHQEQSFNSHLSSVDLFTCISKFDRTGVCILSVRDGKIRGTKTHYLKGNQLKDFDSLISSLIFSYYQNSFSLPEKIFLNIRPNNLTIIKQAVELKFNRKILISSSINSNLRKISKLAKLNASQVIENQLNQSDKYAYAIKDLLSHLGVEKENFTIEGYDISHHSGNYAIGSLVCFSKKGPEKSKYRLFNIPPNLSGNDAGSIKHVLERRLKHANPMPDVILIDGGKIQLKAGTDTLSNHSKDSPIVLSIVKGSNRVRATETILSKDGILEMPAGSAGFGFLQQVRDESHRFAIQNNRLKKRKSSRLSFLDEIKGVGKNKKQNLLKSFKSAKIIKDASIEDLCKVPGIGIELARKIKSS